MTEDRMSGEVDERSEIGPRYGAMAGARAAETVKKLKEDAANLVDRIADDRAKEDAAEEQGNATVKVEKKVRDFVIEDGFRIDADTGEILDLVDAPGDEIEDAQTLEVIIQRFFNAESAKASLKAQLKAITENLGAMVKDQDRRLAYLEMVYFPQFGDYLRKNLPRKKKDGTYAKKTIPTAYGKVMLRELPGSMEVEDQEKAVAFLRRYKCEEAIKVTESVLKSKIPEMIRGIIEADTDGTISADSGLLLIPKSEKVKIDAKPKG